MHILFPCFFPYDPKDIHAPTAAGSLLKTPLDIPKSMRLLIRHVQGASPRVTDRY